MSLIIIRWKGGMGGDSILTNILKSDHSILSNVKFDKLNNDHVQVKTAEKNLSWLYNEKHVGNIDLISNLIKNKNKYILKSHLYSSVYNQFSIYTIDITCTKELMPFVVKSCLKKTMVLQKNYNETIRVFKNKLPFNVKYCYTVYNVAHDLNKHIDTINNKGTKLLLLDDWIYDLPKIQSSFPILAKIDQAFRQKWIKHNYINFPSNYYRKCITDNLSMSNIVNSKKLNIYEKYCLLVIGNHKFKIIYS